MLGREACRGFAGERLHRSTALKRRLFHRNQRLGTLVQQHVAAHTEVTPMYFTNGGINTFFLFGFAQNEGDDMLLHTTASAEAGLRVVRKGAREADYPFEPVILVGSLLVDDIGQPFFVARLTLSASKQHVPRQLKWRRAAYPATLDFEPVDVNNRFRIREDLLARLPDQVAWPEWVRALATREGGEFELMLDKAISSKRCWSVGLLAGFVRVRSIEVIEDEGGVPDFALDVRLRPQGAAPCFEGRLSAAVPGGREMAALLRRRNPARSPVTLISRPMLAANKAEPEGWVLRIEDVREATASDLVNPVAFLDRKPAEPVAHA